MTETTRYTALVDDYYAEHYVQVHGTGILGAAQRGTHERLERGRSRMRFPITLEVGAGSLQHYPFVRHAREHYIATDIRPPVEGPFVTALEQRTAPGNLTFQLADATRLPFASQSVDRIVAGCLAVHLKDPLAAIIEWQRVCRPCGVIDFLVPCDPGLLLRVFRRMVSEPSAKRRGVAPAHFRLINALDHVSSFERMVTLTRAALEPHRDLRITYYPLRFLPSWNLNAFAVFTIRPS